jgi:aspartyl-tRNA(Asn)/glutamyl-tRNA(Gln) amidotransferase subunit A
LTNACLKRIETIDPRLNSFITVTPGSALKQAAELDEETTRGRNRGPLHGIPIALKDLLDTAGVRTTGASAHFKDRVPDDDAEVVRRLKNAGAVLLGKLNMDEFAYSFTSETSYFGPIHNPWDLKRTPGGSSGGCGAAVAAGLCYGAVGSDTGGSIRMPAAVCGIVGLKPSLGLVSTRGALSLAWSLDHLGPMCRTVADTAAMLQEMAGYDPQDPASKEFGTENYARQTRKLTTGLRVGVAEQFFFDAAESEIIAAVLAAMEVIGKISKSRRDVVLPDGSLPVIYAEAFMYHEERMEKKPELFHPQTRRNIELGRNVTIGQYARALRQLQTIRHQARILFHEVDVIITPTTPAPPFLLNPGSEPDLILLRNAIPFNIYNLPTISVPCGFTHEGLPIGMQISAAPGDEGTVFALAAAYERETDWHTRRPPLA